MTIRKLRKLPAIVLCFALTLTLMAMAPSGLYTEAMTEYPYYAFCAITGEFIEEDYIIRSTATIDCNFYDDTVLVVLTKRTSRQFREIGTQDFPELDLYSVTCLTPGVELARSQLTARVSRRVSTYYYDARWSINTDYFRRILSLRLAVPCRQNVLDAISLLQRRPDVRSASPNTYYIAEQETVMPARSGFAPFSTQYHLWNLNRIQLQSAHNITTGSSNIRVGLLSSGVNINHPDLQGRVCTRLSRNFHHLGGDALVDWHGHGTRIAGIIVGNTTGIAPNTQLVSLNVARPNEQGGVDYNSAAVARAIRDVTNDGHADINNRIHILSLSSTTHRHYTPARDAIRQFPGVFVGSAGNGNNNADNRYPLIRTQRINNKIVVGASEIADGYRNVKRDSSNFGRHTVCIFAPGTDIQTTDINNGFLSVQGTSHATPHVAGVAALMLAANPNLSGCQIRDIIIDSANCTKVGVNYCRFIRYQSISGVRGGGRLNALRAVRAAQAIPLLQTRVTFASGANSQVQITGIASGFSGHLVIPSRLSNGHRVTSIMGYNTIVGLNPSNRGAFEGHTGLTGVSIPDTVSYIGWRAFGGANQIRQMTLPFVGNNLTSPPANPMFPVMQTPTPFGSIFAGSLSANPNLSVPSSLLTVNITGGMIIGGAAGAGTGFAGSRITWLFIPFATTIINANAFLGCNSLLIYVIGRATVPAGWQSNWNPDNRPVAWRP